MTASAPRRPYLQARLIVKLLAFVGICIGGLLAVIPLAILFNAVELPEAIGELILNAVLAAVVLAASWFCLRIFEGAPLRIIGIGRDRPYLAELFGGAVAGGLLVCAAWAVFAVAGWATTTTDPAAPRLDLLGRGPAMLVGAAICLTVAALEELLCRGFAFQLLARWNLPAAITLVGLLFAAIHFPAMGEASREAVLPIVNVFLAHGLFAALLLTTKGLWVPIGVHAGWNFALGFGFGMIVSGYDVGISMLRTKLEANIWTGGQFGAEGGLIVTVLLVLAIAIVWTLLPRGPQPLFCDDEHAGQIQTGELSSSKGDAIANSGATGPD